MQQGASLRSVSRQSGVDVRQLRLSTDIRLSDLHKWQKALDVPLTELLVEPDASLSPPVAGRAQMVRLMKTAAAIRERSESVGIQRMAQMLCEQLADIMPELEEVGPWHDYGQRRSLDECGRIVDRTISDDLLRHASAD
jgi:hypothetical protein